MYVIRRIQQGDLEHLEHLAMSYTMGVTSLPKNQKKLEEKLRIALYSFSPKITEPSHELYLFLAEETTTGEIHGISGIQSRLGAYEPAYFYRLETARTEKGNELPKIQILRPVSHQFGPTEICSLFVLRGERHTGVGKLLSFARFLFMADHPHRFEETTVASMRGVITKEGTSPFWDGICRHFVNMSFKGAMALKDKGLFHFYDLLPEHPIYLPFVPKKARQMISKVHTNTRPALKLLQTQGFSVTNEIDIMDGGPTISAPTKEIKAICNSVESKISKISKSLKKGRLAIVSNTLIDFRACYTKMITRPDGSIEIPQETAAALKLEIGDSIRYLMLPEKSK